MSDALDRAKTRSHDIQTGPNSIIIIDSKTGNVTQNISLRSQETTRSLALLLAFVQEMNNDDAIRASNELAREAAKELPDKGRIIELWTQIVSSLPSVVKIIEITTGIFKLFT